MEPEDLDMLYHIENDQHLWDIGATNVPYSRYTLHDYIANSSGDIYVDRQVRLVIENEEGQTVGLVDLTNFDPKHLRAEVGLVIERPMRMKGYADSVVEAIHRYAKQTLHLHQVYAVVGEENKPALALFQKHHYEQTSLLKDWIYDGTSFHSAIVMQKVLSEG
jgi:diamine N-acetyltransferase